MHCGTEFAKQVLPKFFKPAPTIDSRVDYLWSNHPSRCRMRTGNCACARRRIKLAEVKGHTCLVPGLVPYKGYEKSKFIPL